MLTLAVVSVNMINIEAKNVWGTEMARKTIKVADVVGFVNEELARVNSTVEGRQAMMLLAERVLHEAGCYKGFFYLSDLDLPKEVKPGIRYYDNGGVNDEHKFDDTDQTRVQYFI